MIDGELQSKFTDYIEEFKQQDINTKRKEVVDSLKELISVLDVVCQKSGVSVQYLRSREINDIEKSTATEDDYLEAYLVYIENVKNIISKYLLDKDLV